MYFLLLTSLTLGSTSAGVWTRNDLPGIDADLVAADPTNSQHVVVSDTDDVFLFESTDGGQSWTVLPVLADDGSFNSILFDSNGVLFATISNDNLDNSVAIWKSGSWLVSAAPEYVHSMTAMPGGGVIFNTSYVDAVETMSADGVVAYVAPQPVNYPAGNTIAVANGDIFFGDHGEIIYRWDHTAATWTNVTGDLTLDLDDYIRVYADSANNVFASNDNGKLYQYHDGLFKDVASILNPTTPPTLTAVSAVAVDGAQLYGYGPGGIYSYTAGDSDWTLVEAVAVSPNNGAVSHGVIYVTDSAGVDVLNGTESTISNTLTAAWPNTFALDPRTTPSTLVTADDSAPALPYTSPDGVTAWTAGDATDFYADSATGSYFQPASNSFYVNDTVDDITYYVTGSPIYHSPTSITSWDVAVDTFAGDTPTGAVFDPATNALIVAAENGVFVSFRDSSGELQASTNWTQVYSSGVNAVVLDGTNLYIGASNGVYVSVNDGTTFEPVAKATFAASYLAVDPSSHTVYALCTSGCPSGSNFIYTPAADGLSWNRFIANNYQWFALDTSTTPATIVAHEGGEFDRLFGNVSTSLNAPFDSDGTVGNVALDATQSPAHLYAQINSHFYAYVLGPVPDLTAATSTAAPQGAAPSPGPASATQSPGGSSTTLRSAGCSASGGAAWWAFAIVFVLVRTRRFGSKR